MLIYAGMAPLTRHPLSDVSAVALAETFKVLGDTTRVRILDAVSRSELCVYDIARHVGLSESAVSHQLRLLRGTRLVRARRDGRQVFYTLDDQHIVGLFEQGLEHIEERVGANPQVQPPLGGDGAELRRGSPKGRRREGGRSVRAHASAPATRRRA